MKLTSNLEIKYSYSNKDHKICKKVKISKIKDYFIYILAINTHKSLYFNMKYY